MPNEALPYLVPTPEDVTLEAWRQATENGWERLPDALPEWDPTTTLELRRRTIVDYARLLDACRLDPADTLAWAVSWTSVDSRMRGHAPARLLDRTGTTHLAATLPGDRLGSGIVLRTSLVLLHTDRRPQPGIAQRGGSVLAQDFFRVALGSTAQRFPIHTVDFASTRLDPDSSWHMETTTDLAAPFLGTFLLLLNTRDRELVAAVTGRQRTARQSALVDELDHSVAALLLELAVRLRTELHEGAWPIASVGEVLEHTLRRGERTRVIDRPSGADNLARTRTQLLGATRAAGHGRLLQ